MFAHQAWLLIGAVLTVGVLHTLVPDHWVPITVMSRQQRWSTRQTALAAFGAGLGHTISTLAIGVVIWVAGVAIATRFGHYVSLASSLALIVFGGWVAVGALREVVSHTHHRHDQAPVERPSSRMALMLILGSSPMVEGIPAFLAASRSGLLLVGVMSVVFAFSTIVTYVALCVYSARTLGRMSFGPLERYGEVLSGTIVAVIGLAFLVWPA